MRKNAIPNFIEKTWEMLEGQVYGSIIRWKHDGNSFQIVDEATFSEELLPHYFKHSNFSSFIRQLNMYNFHKRKTIEGVVEFHHRLFRRNQQQLLIGIKRKPSEADLQLGDELIRKLTPEFGDENLPVQQPRYPEPLPRTTTVFKEQTVPEGSQTQFLRPVLCVMPWHENQGQFSSWTMQKKVTTMIIKTPPSFGFGFGLGLGTENRM